MSRVLSLLLAALVAVALVPLGASLAYADDDHSCTVKLGSNTCVVDLGDNRHDNCVLSVAATADVLCTLPRDRWNDRDHRWDGNDRDRDRNCFAGQFRDRDGRCVDGPVRSNDGDCVTFRNNNRTYGDGLNDAIRRYNDLVDAARRPGSEDGVNLSDGERRAIQRASDEIRDRRGGYDRTSNDLRTICRDDTPEVSIINQQPAPAQITVAPAPAPVVTPAPAPSSGSGGGIPQGHVDNGGFDAAHSGEDSTLRLALGFGGLAVLVAGTAWLARHYWVHRAR